MDWLVGDKLSLPVDPESVHFIKTPTEFFETLISRIEKAEKQIILASLYLGTGDLETKLITELKKALDDKPELQVHILLDYLRGTRGAPAKSSCAMLQALSNRANVYFYHTPDLRGMVKNMLPARMNEIVGLQHMKFYAFDDAVIISGANLSDSYFVDRQDRYVLIDDNANLVKFFRSIFDAVSSSSFQLKIDGSLELHNECMFHPYQGNKLEYCTDISSKIKLTMDKFRESTGLLPSEVDAKDTVVYPFLQFGPFGINDEVEMLTKLFSRNQPDLDVTVATGYFNPYDEYLDVILKKSNFPMKFLYAAPDANGFYNAEGFSGYVPSLYVDISKNFYEQIKLREKKIKLYEYSRPNWTFHGKGIWIEDDKNGISATMLGSSNYGYRSVCRDLESQVLLVTSNEKLRAKLREERNALFEFTSIVEASTFVKRDHFVPFWIPEMPVAPGLGFGLLTARILSKVKKADVATSTVVLNYRASEERLSKIQCRDEGTERNAKERLLKVSSKHQNRVQKSAFSSDAFKNEELKRRIGGYSIRKLHARSESTDPRAEMTQQELTDVLSNEKWVAVYRFPGIIFCSFISKAKFLQTVASALSIPYITYLYAAGYQPLQFMVLGFAAAVLAPAALVGFTMTFNKLIGIVSMTESNEYIRIGYLSFFGTRRNLIMALNDFTPLSEVVSSPEKLVKVHRYSDPKAWFYLSTRGVQVVDEERAKLLFGRLDYFKTMDVTKNKQE